MLPPSGIVGVLHQFPFICQHAQGPYHTWCMTYYSCQRHHLTLIHLNNWSVSSCSIQLSSLPTTQSIFMPSVNLLIVSPTIISKLLIYRRSNQGRSTDPCGTMGTVTTATVHACPMPPSTTPILDPICQCALAPRGSFHLIDFPHPTSDLVNTLTTVHMDDINHTSSSIPFVICSWSSN